MIIDTNIIKIAEYTYGRYMAESRNHAPQRPEMPAVEMQETGVHTKSNKKPTTQSGLSMWPKLKTEGNRPADGDNYDAFSVYTNTFRNTISGTGNGPRYWTSDNTRNPYSQI